MLAEFIAYTVMLVLRATLCITALWLPAFLVLYAALVGQLDARSGLRRQLIVGNVLLLVLYVGLVIVLQTSTLSVMVSIGYVFALLCLIGCKLYLWARAGLWVVFHRRSQIQKSQTKVSSM